MLWIIRTSQRSLSEYPLQISEEGGVNQDDPDEMDDDPEEIDDDPEEIDDDDDANLDEMSAEEGG